MSNSIQTLLHDAVQQLRHSSDSARIDAEILLAHCLQQSRTYLMTWPEKLVEAATLAHFEQLLAQRLQGHPIAHLIGERDFWTLQLQVSADTLIPRPETELLVETALQYLPAPQAGYQPKVLDLGTGSGAIALALASERPDCQVVACDASVAALQIAELNRQRYQLNNVSLHTSNWFAQLAPQHFDLIVSNPPYIEQDDPHLQQGDVRFEPLSALTAGSDGLDDLRHIISSSPQWLNQGAWLLLEHGYNQSKQVGELLTQAHFQQVGCLQDLAANDRVSLGQWP